MRYFAMIDGECRGPFEISELVAAGVTPHTFVWCKEMTDWQPAEEVADICRFWRRRLAGESDDNDAPAREADSGQSQDFMSLSIGRGLIIGPDNDKMLNPDKETERTPPPGGLIWAVLTTILCFPPTGFVAIYMFWLSAAEWKQSIQSPKVEDAERLRAASWNHSRLGRMWTGITFFLGLILYAFMMRYSI